MMTEECRYSREEKNQTNFFLNRILHETPFEGRQIDLSLVVDQYQQILLSLTSKPEVSLATLVEGLSLLTRTLQVRNYTRLVTLDALQCTENVISLDK